MLHLPSHEYIILFLTELEASEDILLLRRYVFVAAMAHWLPLY
jgi:hypothetical protein